LLYYHCIIIAYVGTTVYGEIKIFKRRDGMWERRIKVGGVVLPRELGLRCPWMEQSRHVFGLCGCNMRYTFPRTAAIDCSGCRRLRQIDRQRPTVNQRHQLIRWRALSAWQRRLILYVIKSLHCMLQYCARGWRTQWTGVSLRFWKLE